MRLLVSMGVPLASGHGTGGVLRGRLREIDADRRRIVRELAVEVEHGPGPDAHQELTCAEMDADLVLQAAHTELLWIDPRTLRVVRRVTNPLFHGVHSASPLSDGHVIVTCAGTESVVVVDRGGATVAHHFLRGGDFAAAYPGIGDFRKVDHEALKPHTHHPNHACEVAGERWVTCFETREARTLAADPRRVTLPEGFPHDGRLREGLLWFTQVDGRVVAVDPVTLARRHVIDVAALAGSRARPGWCRGVEVSDGRLFVGFTQLRSTRHREVLRWLLEGPAGLKLPSRVVEVSLQGTPTIVGETLVGDDGRGTVYGILAVPD